MKRVTKGFALVDIVASITILLILFIPALRLLHTAQEMLLRAEYLDRSVAVMDSAVEKLRTEEWKSGNYREDDFEVSIHRERGEEDRIEVVHIIVRNQEEVLCETRIYEAIH